MKKHERINNFNRQEKNSTYSFLTGEYHLDAENKRFYWIESCESLALFKLLGDQVLFPVNQEIEKLENGLYPIIKILRTESNGTFEYSIEDDIVIISQNEEILRIKIQEFKKKSIILLEAIKESKERTFSIPLIEEFMKTLQCFSLKASSSSKTDITIVVHDKITNQKPILGFRIKSQLGSPSTLLNAGKTTNFIYKITGEINIENINHVNSLVIKRGNKTSADIKGRVKEISKIGCNLKFEKTEKKVFYNNLTLIDSRLPELISQIVLDFYSSTISNLKSLVELSADKNPLNFDMDNNHKFYEYKLKHFLTDTAIGMMPSKVWDGNYDATGGYLIVKENGDVLCYHLYKRNEFENYLLNNTKLETASSTRHNFGEIYEEKGEYYLKLNLQIRFIK